MTKHLINTHAFDGISYGFLSRADGVSNGIYSGLNCGPGSDDDPALVTENRKIAAALVSSHRKTSLVSCYQVHGNTAVPVTTDWGNDRPKADAMVTSTPGILIGILTADCTPVLFADPAAGVVGAAHAGWKGALGGVLENTVTAMEKIGANRSNITAMIGPTIHQKSYEVGGGFRNVFMDVNASHAVFFTSGKDDDHFQFDLPGFVAHQLKQAGVKHIHDTAVDTYSSVMHFSYRRTTHQGENDYGRQISAIMLIP